ncbi:MAG TPA: cold shock domain-containing protein [Bacilli bacterium]|nr:cold shock domain-containing protein [Bacilli bacterium]
MQGIVKWFNNEKGFGFIEYLPGKDVFVHYSMIKMNGYKTLNEGDLVQYDLMDTNKGLQATNVEILKQVQATK